MVEAFERRWAELDGEEVLASVQKLSLAAGRGATCEFTSAGRSVTEQYVQHIERGLQNPILEVLARLARALGITLPELVGVENGDGDSR